MHGTEVTSAYWQPYRQPYMHTARMRLKNHVRHTHRDDSRRWVRIPPPRWREAVEAYKDVLKDEPDHQTAHRKVGKCIPHLALASHGGCDVHREHVLCHADVPLCRFNFK